MSPTKDPPTGSTKPTQSIPHWHWLLRTKLNDIASSRTKHSSAKKNSLHIVKDLTVACTPRAAPPAALPLQELARPSVQINKGKMARYED